MAESDPDEPVADEPVGTPWGRVVASGVAVVVIFVLTLGTIGLIWLTEPEPQREGAVRRTAMLVEVASVERGTYNPELVALGTVRPEQDIQLQPRVSGQVLEVAEDFVPGRVLPAGTVLLRIDPADARNRLAQQQSALRQAEAALALERGRQAVAKTERAQIQGDVSAEQEALITREPQLQAALAAVESARAAVTQAELELQRTRVTTPFDALVLERSAHVGSQVTPSTLLGRLVGVDRFWVELTVPTSRLRHLAPRRADGSGTSVVVRDRAAWAEGEVREGHLESIVSQVDDRTRMARLLVAIPDPLGLEVDGPPLMAGSWVEARLAASELQDVVRIERAWLRKDDTVWEMDEGKLRIREVEVVLQDDQHAYIASGLDADAQVVTSDLSTVSDGAPLRTTSEAP